MLLAGAVPSGGCPFGGGHLCFRLEPISKSMSPHPCIRSGASCGVLLQQRSLGQPQPQGLRMGQCGKSYNNPPGNISPEGSPLPTGRVRTPKGSGRRPERSPFPEAGVGEKLSFKRMLRP